jgi:hypothetical protein
VTTATRPFRTVSPAGPSARLSGARPFALPRADSLSPPSSRPRVEESGGHAPRPPIPSGPASKHKPLASESPVWAGQRPPVWGMRSAPLRHYNLVNVEPGASITPLLRPPGFPVGFAPVRRREFSYVLSDPTASHIRQTSRRRRNLFGHGRVVVCSRASTYYPPPAWVRRLSRFYFSIRGRAASTSFHPPQGSVQPRVM